MTGWEVDGDELATTARRIVVAKRRLNARFGATAADDWLPARFLDEGLTVASGREARLPAARLRAMIDAYYAARGLGADGAPTAATLAELGLPPVAV